MVSDQLVVQVFSSVFSSVAFYYAQTKASEVSSVHSQSVDAEFIIL